MTGGERRPPAIGYSPGLSMGTFTVRLFPVSAPVDRDGGGGALVVTAGSPERSREHWIAEEQAALRRVTVLVARAAPPDQVFTAVTEEAGRLLAPATRR